MIGQIVNRGPNTWLVRVPLGRDSAGRRKYHNHTVHGTKKDAQRYLVAVQREIDLGTFVEPANTTVNAYLDDWLETVAKSRVRSQTFTDYAGHLARYVRPALGERRLTTVTPVDIQGVYAGMLERGLSARTIRYTHAVLRSAFKQAVRWRLLSTNPAEYVELPRQERKEMRTMTPEEAKRFLAAVKGSKWGLLFAFALVTGMRPEEYLALQWSDIDLKAGTARVQRVLVRLKGGGWRWDEPKTAKSRRTVPLPPPLVQDLAAYRRQQLERRLRNPGGEDHNLVFPNDTGEPLDLHNLISRHFKPALKAAELPADLRLYDLRHTCATLLLAEGIHPKVVAERLGHSSINLTMDVYSHVLPTMQRDATDRLSGLLFG